MKSFIQIPVNRCTSTLRLKSDIPSVCGILFFMEKKPIDFTPPDSRLTFIRKTSKGSGNYNTGEKVIRAKALYRCSCGNEIETAISNAKNGKTKSCGCLHKDSCSKANSKHGLGRHPLYPVYKSMVQRCTNPNNPAYPDYGGKGVIVCSLWKNSFKEFHDWCLANGWQKGMQVDKDLIPKKLGIPALEYSPDMCSILTRKQNANAKSNNRPIEYNGEIKNLCEWADQIGISHSVLQNRIKKGWPLHRALSPLKKEHRHIRVNSEIKSKILNTLSVESNQTAVARMYNVDAATVNRIYNQHKKSCHIHSV